jgi:anti-sigma factor RsiW
LDHRHALETLAAERYILGELPAVEAEEFELHYFECPQCALAVESGQMFVLAAQENLPAVEMPARQTAPACETKSSLWASLAAFWRQPGFALAAAALLAAIALYQGAVVIPGLRQPRTLPAFQLIGASRGEDPKIVIPAGTPFVALSADVPPEIHSRNYTCVVSSGGKTVLTVVNPAPEEGHPITILVPTDKLRSGKQEFAIYAEGSGAKPISTYPFDFEINQ